MLKTDDIMSSERSHYNLRCRARYTLPEMFALLPSSEGRASQVQLGGESARGPTEGSAHKLLAQKLLSDAQEYTVVCLQ